LTLTTPIIKASTSRTEANTPIDGFTRVDIEVHPQLFHAKSSIMKRAAQMSYF
jgi:hypothetical protein